MQLTRIIIDHYLYMHRISVTVVSLTFNVQPMLRHFFLCRFSPIFCFIRYNIFVSLLSLSFLTYLLLSHHPPYSYTFYYYVYVFTFYFDVCIFMLLLFAFSLRLYACFGMACLSMVAFSSELDRSVMLLFKTSCLAITQYGNG